jgi:hypothetical protein
MVEFVKNVNFLWTLELNEKIMFPLEDIPCYNRSVAELLLWRSYVCKD